MINDSFCAAAWFNVRNDNDGTLKACTCIDANESYNIKTSTIEDWRNSDHMLKLREDHSNNTKPKSCQQCWKMEELGLQSQRMQYNEIIDLKWAELYFKHHKTFETTLTLASDLKIGNKCNLECAMCSPEYSSKIAKTWRDKPSLEFTTIVDSKAYQNPVLEKFMDELFQHPIRFVNILGGEPLMDKRVLNKLKTLKDKHKISLNFITNGTFNISEYNKQLGDFKSIHYGISVDGLGEVNKYIRRHSKWEQVRENLMNDNVHIICTVQALNIETIPILINFAFDHNIKMQFIPVHRPEFLSLDAVRPEVLKKITNKELQPFIDNAVYKPALREKFERYIKWYEN